MHDPINLNAHALQLLLQQTKQCKNHSVQEMLPQVIITLRKKKETNNYLRSGSPLALSSHL